MYEWLYCTVKGIIDLLQRFSLGVARTFRGGGRGRILAMVKVS